MGLRQSFFFEADAVEVRSFLHTMSAVATVEDRGDFFVFRAISGPAFTFDCEIVPEGLLSERGGEYLSFLGYFVEQLTGYFGRVAIEDM